MKYAYFPGCSADSTARDMHASTLAVAKKLGIELVEPKGWVCCGATAAHQTDRTLAAVLPSVSLMLVHDMNMEMVVNCAACYNRMKTANHEIQSDSSVRERVHESIGRDYNGSVNVRHFIEVLLEDIGLETISNSLKKTLNGLKIACYYGCLMVRPPEIMNFDEPENPSSLERLVTTLGGESLEWSHKVECCGGGLSLTRTDVVVKLTNSVLEMAQSAGAQCVAVTCPMCQSNLDLRQKDIAKETGKRYDIPILYITQLLGLCLGIPPKELGMNKLMISPTDVLKSIERTV